MYNAASDPALMATDLAEWLVKNKVPFRQAHHRVGHLVAFCREHEKTLDKVSLEEMKSVIPEANVSRYREKQKPYTVGYSRREGEKKSQPFYDNNTILTPE